MTRWQALIAFLCITQASAGQNSGCIGLEITEAVRSGNARIRIAYGLSDQWSAEVLSSFHIKSTRSENEKTSGIHNGYVDLSFRHWCRKFSKGPYFSLGIFSGVRQRTDMKFCLGYAIPIWKGIGMDIGYGFKVLDTIRQNSAASGEITLEIHYCFTL